MSGGAGTGAGGALHGLRSVVFVVQMYAAMALLAVVFLPWALVSRNGAFAAIRTYCRWVRWSAARIVGLRSEIRGPVPEGEVLIASKHQSFFDIILLCSVLPRPRFIMKKELRWAPVLGWYAQRIGCVPVDRGRRGAAIRQMVEEVRKGRREGGQLIIFPQGTRVAPGERRPYKVGSGVLYREMGSPCVPAATNVGLFWPRRSLMRRPGLAVVEFLPAIPPGAPLEAFMRQLEAEVEGASDRLMAEAGHPPPPPRDG
jgi:1-acyl-sn-glycerol-3-phosphate acyltransferase